MVPRVRAIRFGRRRAEPGRREASRNRNDISRRFNVFGSYGFNVRVLDSDCAVITQYGKIVNRNPRKAKAERKKKQVSGVACPRALRALIENPIVRNYPGNILARA